MLSVVGLSSTIYGLFAAQGSDMHFEQLGQVGAGENVSALSSENGSDVFVGTDQGNIYRMVAPYTTLPSQLAINPPSLMGGRSIGAIVELFPTVAFAAMNINGNTGFVLGWLGTNWNVVGAATLPMSLPFGAMEMPDASDLFVASRAQVFFSADLGNTWSTASNGLPALDEATDLHAVLDPDGTRYLYLSSYGRSMWRTALP